MTSDRPAMRRASFAATACGVAAGALVAILFGSHSGLPRASEASERADPCVQTEAMSLRAIATVASEFYGSSVHLSPAQPAGERAATPRGPRGCDPHS